MVASLSLSLERTTIIIIVLFLWRCKVVTLEALAVCHVTVSCMHGRKGMSLAAGISSMLLRLSLCNYCEQCLRCAVQPIVSELVSSLLSTITCSKNAIFGH